jgi:methionine sulfoxide reductase heme-binding subunit
MSGHNPLDYPWWLASRSAGIVAYLLLSAAVVLGLVMATRSAPPRLRPAIVATHERVALLALAAVAAHGLLLLGDSWLHPGLSGVVVPFTIGYRPVWTGIGVLGGYLAAALSLSYYLRRRIGVRRWRKAHRLIPVAWAMAVVHVFGAGSDAETLLLEVPLALTIGTVAILLGRRLLPSRAPQPAPSRS